jgi:hypothetical protein
VVAAFDALVASGITSGIKENQGRRPVLRITRGACKQPLGVQGSPGDPTGSGRPGVLPPFLVGPGAVEGPRRLQGFRLHRAAPPRSPGNEKPRATNPGLLVMWIVSVCYPVVALGFDLGDSMSTSSVSSCAMIAVP